MKIRTSPYSAGRRDFRLSGFTLVELLIVVVIIAILAAITVVAYNGIQHRAQDNSRYSDAKSIMTLLEDYRIDKGYYPATNATASAVCGTHNNGYSYSDATDNTWLKPMVIGNYTSRVPIPNPNNCNVYYSYLDPGATAYSCPSRTINYYILQVVGENNTFVPSEALANGVTWKPCTGATAGWTTDANHWVIVKEES